MRNLLTKHGIPTTTLAAAVEFLNSASDATVTAFNHEFGLYLTGDDGLTAARFAADAIFRGAGAVDKVVGYVGKRMTGQAVQAAPAPPARVVMVGTPVVDTPEVTIVPVVVADETGDVAPVVKVAGRRGRKRLGNSDFCKTARIIDANPKADRETIKALVVAAGIKEASVPVYLWRYYTKGERA